MTPDDIQRVARAYVKPDRLSIVLVGNARFFVQQLSQMGFSGMEIIPIDDLDLMSATLKKEARRGADATPVAPSRVAYSATQVNPRAGQPAVTEGSRASDDPVQVLLRRLVLVKGGLAGLKRVRTLVADADTTFRLERGPLASTTRTYVAYPDRFRVDATVSGAEVIQVFNGGAAWVKDPSGVHDAPAAMRSAFAASVQRDVIPLLIAAVEGTVAARLLPEEGRDGAVLKVIELSGPQLQPVKLFVNDQMLVARQSYAAPGPDGQPLQAEEVFSDYRAVEGIRVAFKAAVLQNGRPILDRTLTRVVINGALDETLFARPQ